MKRRFTGAAAMAVTAVALLGATEASAAKGPISASFSEDGSNGYNFSVFGGEQGVTVNASKKSANASYSTNGTANAKKIRATFQGYGKVKMRFNQKGKSERVKPPKGCKGPDTIVKRGTWKGIFKFKGENGYSKVSTKKAKGTVTQPESDKPLDCSGGGGGNGKKCVILSSFDKNGFFSAQKIDGKKPSFSISTSDKKNGISIFRSAFASGGQFDSNVNQGTATLKPPSPFKGTGNYSDGELTGSLKAKLPGDTVSIKGSASLSDGKCF